jgi:hypothetical protein
MSEISAVSLTIDRPETYSKADLDPHSNRPLDKGITGQELPGNAKTNDGFFEKGILQALESDHVSHTAIPEVKVIGNGHCHRRCLFARS